MLHYTINKLGCRLRLFYNSSEKKEVCVCEKVFPKYKVISRDKIMPRSILFCTLSLLLSGCSQLLDIVDEVIKLHADISEHEPPLTCTLQVSQANRNEWALQDCEPLHSKADF